MLSTNCQIQSYNIQIHNVILVKIKYNNKIDIFSTKTATFTFFQTLNVIKTTTYPQKIRRNRAKNAST